MSFTRRLTLYLFGFLIGLAIVFAFFGDRLNFFTDWFPNNRVLAILRDDEIELSDRATCEMECLDLEYPAVEEVLKSGDVDFKNSDPQADPRLYVIDLRHSDGRKYRFYFETHEATSIITQVLALEYDLSCECS